MDLFLLESSATYKVRSRDGSGSRNAVVFKKHLVHCKEQHSYCVHTPSLVIYEELGRGGSSSQIEK